jgi:hypothetical protein
MTEKFQSVFDGFREAYGVYNGVSEQRTDGKLLGSDRRTVRGELGQAQYAAHLQGSSRLGVIPIAKGNTCVFGAIDVDIYDGLDHVEFVRRLRRFHLPLIVCRSKSGGAHLYAFASEPVPAANMQRRLKEIASFLGHGSAEVFPKQSVILDDGKDLGSWINLPYFGGIQGLCYALHPETGDAMDVGEFLAAADAAKAPPGWFVTPLSVAPDLPQGPPCLQHLVQLGFPPGTRNSGLFNLGVYARKVDPDNWKTMVDNFNQQHMQPPLGSEEVTGIVKSLNRKTYRYRCNDQPICGHCDTALCRTRKFGVGAGGEMPALGQLSKLDTDPPLWIWEIDGQRIKFATDDLLDPNRFQRRVVENTSPPICPPVPKREVWHAAISAAMKDVDIIPIPDDIGIIGQLLSHLEQFCNGRAQADQRDGLLLGKPYTDPDDARTYFRMMDFQRHLSQARWDKMTDNELAAALKERGATHGRWTAKGRTLRWWSVPAFNQQTEGHGLPASLIEGEKPF